MPWGDHTGTRSEAVRQAAERLRQAGTLRRPCPPVRDLIGSGDLDLAYAVQRRVFEMSMASGAVRVGRKIGLTSEVAQRRLRATEPDHGVLLDLMRVPDRGTVAMNLLLQPRIEVGIAFELGADLDLPEPGPADVRAAVRGVATALEIIDSRMLDWDVTLADTVADNASTGMFALADGWSPLGGRDLRRLGMTLLADGVPVSTGSGAACLGDPVRAVQWLARTAAAQGDPLRAGEIVLSGALGPLTEVWEGTRYIARVEGLGTVEVGFAARRDVTEAGR